MSTATTNRVRPSITPILAVNFVGTLGFSVVLPFLVFLVTRWGGNALIYGIMGATYSVFQFIGAPILGRWSDTYGRRKILLLSQLGTLVSWVIFVSAFALPERALATVSSGWLGEFTLTAPLLVMFVARALDGLTGGNVSVANAYLADVTDEDDRSANFGKMAVSANLGFVVGPAVAGVLSGTPLGELLPVLAALAISATASALIVFKLKESNPCSLRRDPAGGDVGDILGPDHKECYELKAAQKHTFADVMRLPLLPRILAIKFFVMLGFNFFYVAFPVYAVSGLQWTVTQTGLFFSVLSILMVAVQGPVLRWASGRWSDGVLTVGGILILAVSFIAFSGGTVQTIYAGAALLALGNGLMWPSITAILSKTAGPDYQGAVQGVAGSGSAFASILGLLAGGLLYGILEVRLFLLASVLIAIAFLLSLSLISATRQSGT